MHTRLESGDAPFTHWHYSRQQHINKKTPPTHSQTTIVCKITQRNNIGRANTCDPALKLLNEEITSDIQKHKQNIWKEHLDAYWDHRHNTHILWKTIHGLSNRALPTTLNNSITYNKITNTPKHIATCSTNNSQPRNTQNIQGYNITLTTSQVQEAIKQSKNNNSQGPAKLNIRHLKHIGPLGLAFLTSMFKTALNKNIIPHTWKLANIIPIPNPTKTQTRAPHTGPYPSSQSLQRHWRRAFFHT